MSRIASLAALAAVLGFVSPAPADGKRYAVLVGVNQYDHPRMTPLGYAAADAAELGRVLARAGYQVTVLATDDPAADRKPTKANIDREVARVLRLCGRGDLVVVGLSGHGFQFDGQKDGYFCPSDCKPFPDETATMVSLGRLYQDLDKSNAGMKVLLVDACRVDPKTANTKGVAADTGPTPPKGVAALFSCSAGQFSWESKDLGHGAFFHHVIEGLKGAAKDGDGDVTFAALAAYVSKRVPKEVAKLSGDAARQSPNMRADYSDEPVLLTVPAAAAADRPGSADAAAALREADARAEAKEFAEAARLYRRAADLGDPAAMTRLGEAYDAGTGVGRDEAEAVRWFRKAAAAGDPAGMNSLGFMYEKGRGVDPDPAAAARWYRHAAAAGLPLAMANLGYLYEAGKGVGRDYAEAARWYRKAADLGESRGMNDLGVLYDHGRGVPKDPAEAARWYRKAADAGSALGMTNLGALLATGRGVPQDEAEAVRLFRKAADLGEPMGMTNLGAMYGDGRGVRVDQAEALKWTRKGAETGDGMGMTNLGVLFAEGRGVTRDDAEAVRWFRKGADAGIPQGMFNLGMMYESGRGGLAADRAAAVSWYRKAAAEDDPSAADALKRLGEKP